MKRRLAWTCAGMTLLCIVSISHAAPMHENLCVAVSPDGKQLAANMDGGEVVDLFDVATGQRKCSLFTPDCDPLRQFPRGINEVLSLSYSPRGRYLAAATTIGPIFVWDMAANDPANEQPLQLKIDRSFSWGEFVFSADEKSLTAFWRNNSEEGHDLIVSWELKTAKETGRRDLGGAVIDFCTFFPDGSAAVNPSRGASRIEAPPGVKVQHLLPPDWNELYLSRDGKLAVLMSGEDTDLVDTQTGKSIARIEGNHSFATIAISPDNTRVAIAQGEGSDETLEDHIDIYTVKDGKRVLRMTSKELIMSMCFSSDSKRLVAGSVTRRQSRAHDFGAIVLDASNGKTLQTIGLPSPVSVVPAR